MDSATESSSNEFAVLAASGVFYDLRDAMGFYGPEIWSGREIKADLRRINRLENRERSDAFQKWVEAMTKVKLFKKTRFVTELENARNKGKRPAITPRANPEALLTTARMFGNHKCFGAFVKFPDLPKKIRFMIWHYAIESRRFLEVFLVRKKGVSISRDKWDDSRLLNYRSVCKDADTAILTKYHKIWRQDLLPIVAPNFQTVLFDYNADILHLTSYGAMQAALGKFGSSLLKNLRNVGFLFDHFGFWIKRYPDELANMLAKLESVGTIVLEWRDRTWSEEIINEKTGKPKTIIYKYGKPLPTEQVERKEGMKSTYDCYDLLEKPPAEYHKFPLNRLQRERYKNMSWQVKAEAAFRCYIATQPKLHYLKNVRIWFLYPRSEHENRLLRPYKEMDAFLP